MKVRSFVHVFLFALNCLAISNEEINKLYSDINEQSSIYGLPPLIGPENDIATTERLVDEIIFSCPRQTTNKIGSLINRILNRNCPVKIKPQKLLIIGPAGVGKSTLAKGIALLSGRPYKFIKSTELLTKYQHSGAENLTHEIRSILDLNCPYVIIIDEINCLFDGFNKEHDKDKETATALWLALDECASRHDILFIGITNEGKDLPGPLETRFKNHKIEIPLPNSAARKRILHYYMRDTKHCLTKKDVEALAYKMADFSGREIEEIVSQGLALAFDRDPNSALLTRKDLEAALYEIRPHGKIVSTMIDLWKNRKDYFVKSLPHLVPIVIAIAGMALTYYLWATPNEITARGIKLQEEGIELQKRSEVAQSLNTYLQIISQQSQFQGILLQKHSVKSQIEAATKSAAANLLGSVEFLEE